MLMEVEVLTRPGNVQQEDINPSETVKFEVKITVRPTICRPQFGVKRPYGAQEYIYCLLSDSCGSAHMGC
jgi:hypothetical protein